MMRKEWNLQIPLLLALMALGTATGQEPLHSYFLTAYPPSPVDGESLTLSCTDRNGYNIVSAVWIRSEGEIFQTSIDNRTVSITTVTSNMTIYRDEKGRISVSTSNKQHNVTLKVKANIDNGTVWRCQSAHQDSNNITIVIDDHKDTSTATGQGPSPNYTLTAYPPSPVDGQSLTLSCAERHDYDILIAVWFRSGGELFQTSSDRKTGIIITVTSNMAIYRDVEDRISVSTSTKQHNVTLKVKASIDNGTVWICQGGHRDSNSITIVIADHKDTNSTSSSTNNPSTSPRSNVEELSPGVFEKTNNIYIIAGAVGGAVLIILIIAVIVFVKKWRNKQSTEGETSREADVHVYSTMARDDNHDNQYTELSKENISEHNEKTCYYNTVSDAGGHMYENPPLSQTRQT